MKARASATPLLALDAVVIDTETTSLDPAKARIVEIGAVRLTAGRLDQHESFRTLVDPGMPVPSASTRIHGIDDARLAGAPDFRAAWPKFNDFAGGRIAIGYNIEYDLAVLAAECNRTDIEFHYPRAIDVRLLAEVVEPKLSGFSIEHLAAWLSVEVEGRHSALGDAVTTARIFLALVPRLREGGIRTFAEAEAVCRTLTDAVASSHRAGWVDIHRPPAQSDTEGALSRIDAYPYRHRIGEVMSAPPLFVAPDMTVGAAIDLLIQKRVSSAFVAFGSGGAGTDRAEDCGIVTERDLLRALAAEGAPALDKPVGDIASRPLATVPAFAYVYRAIGRMSRLKVRHLGVVDETNCVVGALSARDLLRLRASEAVALGDRIGSAEDVHALAAAWPGLPAAARALLAEGVAAREIAGIISSEVRALTRRAAVLGERRMREAGLGDPPVPYAVLVLGSAGRGESLLAMDQDNAIIFAKGEPDGPEDRWFATLGTHIADILDEVGVPYCKGGVMAKNAAFRGSAKLWRARLAEWFRRTRPEDLLAVDIFFDFRAVYGDGELAESLWRDAYEMARGEIAFLKVLHEAAGPMQPPLGWFGVRTENGRVDLKRGGLFPIVTSARVLAIRHHIAERPTRARLEGVMALEIGAGPDLEALISAHGVLVSAVLEQQLVDIDAGQPPSSKVEWRRLSRAEQQRLREALRPLNYLDHMVRDLLTG
jgi:DNA polymerase-3 subunit epsilon/CBS domain-containing protein